MKRYKSQFMEMHLNELDQAMKNITALLKKNKINFCFIGGVTLKKYGYIRMTNDIDILVAKKDKSKFKKLENEYYTAPQGNLGPYEWIRPQINLDVIYSGQKAGDERGIPYIEPDKISHLEGTLPILDLKWLILYKLSAGIYDNRLKDFGDIQELIKIHNLPYDYISYDEKEELIKKYKKIWKLTFKK